MVCNVNVSRELFEKVEKLNQVIISTFKGDMLDADLKRDNFLVLTWFKPNGEYGDRAQYHVTSRQPVDNVRFVDRLPVIEEHGRGEMVVEFLTLLHVHNKEWVIF